MIGVHAATKRSAMRRLISATVCLSVRIKRAATMAVAENAVRAKRMKPARMARARRPARLTVKVRTAVMMAAAGNAASVMRMSSVRMADAAMVTMHRP
jgi:hypothetical protein